MHARIATKTARRPCVPSFVKTKEFLSSMVEAQTNWVRRKDDKRGAAEPEPENRGEYWTLSEASSGKDGKKHDNMFFCNYKKPNGSWKRCAVVIQAKKGDVVSLSVVEEEKAKIGKTVDTVENVVERGLEISSALEEKVRL